MVRPEALQGLEGHPKALKSTRTGPPRRPKGALEEPQGTPRAAKGPQRAPRGSPKATLRGVWGDQIKQKSVTEAKKVDFGKSAPRPRPCRCAEHFGPPEITPRSTQNGPKWVLEPLEGLLRSLLVAQERFGRPRELPRIDCEPLRCPQKGFLRFS